VTPRSNTLDAALMKTPQFSPTPNTRLMGDRIRTGTCCHPKGGGGTCCHPKGGGVTLQKNFNAGELRYVRNIPGGRRQRAPPDGAAVVISN